MLLTVDSTDHIDVTVALSDGVILSFFLFDKRMDLSDAFDVDPLVISAALTLLTRLLHALLPDLFVHVTSPEIFRAEELAASADDVAGAV